MKKMQMPRPKLSFTPTIIALTLSTITFILIALFLIIFRVEDKHVSMINFYPHPVIINVKGSSFRLDPFDTTQFTMNTKNPIKVEIFNLENQKISEVTAEDVARYTQLFVFPLSDQDKYCAFSSESNVDLEGKTQLINKTVLSDTPKKYFKVDLDFIRYKYLFPGSVPEKTKVDSTKVINYIFPINCAYINNDEMIANTITLFQNYDSVKQREYYAQVKQRIEAAEDLDSIAKSVPGKASEYYTTGDNFVFMFE